MKVYKSILLLALLASSLLVSSCSSDEKKEENLASPSAVALTLYKGLTTGDVKGVTENIYFQDKISTNVFRDYFQMAVASEDYKQRTKGFVPDYKVVSEDINGDDAIVILEGVGPLGNYLKINVKLLKVDGHWKVDGDHGVLDGAFQ